MQVSKNIIKISLSIAMLWGGQVSAQANLLPAFRSVSQVPRTLVELARQIPSEMKLISAYSNVAFPGSPSSHQMLFVEMHHGVMTPLEVGLELQAVEADVLGKLAADMGVDFMVYEGEMVEYALPEDVEIQGRIFDAYDVSDRAALEVALNLVRRIEESLPGYVFPTTGLRGHLRSGYHLGEAERIEVVSRIEEIENSLRVIGLDFEVGSDQLAGVDPLSFSVPSLWRRPEALPEIATYLRSRLRMLKNTFSD